MLRAIWLTVLVFFPTTLWSQESGQSFQDPKERFIEGWTVKVDPLLLTDRKKEGKRALEALANHLQRIKWILDERRVKELQRLPIWLEWNHPSLSNMQYHPSRRWLIQHDCDPRLQKHVHIPRAKDLYARRMWAKHPYVVLHELAHAYHDQFLGFGHQGVIRAFRTAKASGKFQSVLDHRGVKVQHYGMTNEKEYFAEATEAYLGVNDFYPFVRAELKIADPVGFELMRKIWGKLK